MNQQVKPTNLQPHKTPLPLMRPLLDNPKPLIPPPPQLMYQHPTPLMFLNIGYHQQHQQQKQVHDMEFLRHALFINNQQNVLNTPLYTDFSSKKCYKKRSIQSVDAVKEPVNQNIQPPNKILKNTNSNENLDKSEEDVNPDNEYLKKLEQQKKIREAILKKKEERRLQRAQQDQLKPIETIIKNKENETAKVTPEVVIPEAKLAPPPMIIPQAPQQNWSNVNKISNPQNLGFNLVNKQFHQPANNNNNNFLYNNNNNNGIYNNPMHFFASQQQQQQHNFVNRPLLQNFTRPGLDPLFSRHLIMTNPSVRNHPRNVQPLLKSHVIVMIQNLSLSTRQKCILDMCGNIGIKDKV
jgi:hypothetical protein